MVVGRVTEVCACPPQPRHESGESDNALHPDIGQALEGGRQQPPGRSTHALCCDAAWKCTGALPWPWCKGTVSPAVLTRVTCAHPAAPHGRRRAEHAHAVRRGRPHRGASSSSHICLSGAPHFDAPLPTPGGGPVPLLRRRRGAAHPQHAVRAPGPGPAGEGAHQPGAAAEAPLRGAAHPRRGRHPRLQRPHLGPRAGGGARRRGGERRRCGWPWGGHAHGRRRWRRAATRAGRCCAKHARGCVQCEAAGDGAGHHDVPSESHTHFPPLPSFPPSQTRSCASASAASRLQPARWRL